MASGWASNYHLLCSSHHILLNRLAVSHSPLHQSACHHTGVEDEPDNEFQYFKKTFSLLTTISHGRSWPLSRPRPLLLQCSSHWQHHNNLLAPHFLWALNPIKISILVSPVPAESSILSLTATSHCNNVQVSLAKSSDFVLLTSPLYTCLPGARSWIWFDFELTANIANRRVII